MTRYAVAKSERADQVRFFAGRYVGSDFPPSLLTPVTTGQPDEATAYQDRVVAELVMAFLNLLVGIKTGANTKPWIVIELPEEWL